MSRICLVGIGDPSFLPSRHHAGPGLRSGHFATALAERSHDVLVVHVHPGPARLPAGAAPRDFRVRGGNGPRLACLAVSEQDFAGEEARRAVARFEPDALVGVTAHGAALAARLALSVPLWADVFGDLMAEAQAKAAAHGSDASLVHFWKTLGCVLDAADRFSAVSRAQADALIGQLGLAGRLASATAGEALVSVIPCAAEAVDDSATLPDESSAQGLRGPVVDDDAFVALWSGSFNTWCDVDTLFAALERAMRERASIELVATGGPVPGHDERTYERFRERVDASPLRERFHLLGRVDDDRLARIYADADIGVVVERDLYERRLGSENRTAQWMANGLAAVTTARSELGRSLVRRELAFGVPPGDAEALARTLIALADDRGRVRAAGEECRTYADRHLGYAATAAPLLAWCELPRHAGDGGGERPLSLGLLSEPAAMVHLLEGYLSDLTLPQVAYRSVRWLARRLATR